MNCFSQRWRRTSPTRGGSKKELVPSKVPRVNGWSWPPQPLQVAGWVVYIYLGVVSFGILIPLLPRPWNQVSYASIGISFLVHFFAHVATVTIDPADPSVKAKKGYSSPLPLFDRAKQPHVIQNQHCYLCDVTVGPKVKHCGTCNKCVEGFDHHCKWLNTCVGQRNYWFFFVALVSASAGVFVLVCVTLFIFIQHHLNPLNLRTAPQFHLAGNTTWFVFLPLAPIKTTTAGLLTLAFITIMVSAICLVLFCHLLGFHLYLFSKGISTFDYVKKKRNKESRKLDIEAKKSVDLETTSNNVPKILQSQEGQAPSPSSRVSNKRPVSSRLSGPICTEMENFKKSAEKENSFNYGTETPTQNETKVSMSVITSLNPINNEEDQGAREKSIPVEKDPAGSCDLNGSL